MSNKINLSDIKDMEHIKQDIGFQTRFLPMTSHYEPLVNRVEYLETIVGLLLTELQLTIVRNSKFALKKYIKKETK